MSTGDSDDYTPYVDEHDVWVAPFWKSPWPALLAFAEVNGVEIRYNGGCTAIARDAAGNEKMRVTDARPAVAVRKLLARMGRLYDESPVTDDIWVAPQGRFPDAFEKFAAEHGVDRRVFEKRFAKKPEKIIPAMRRALAQMGLLIEAGKEEQRAA